VSLERQRIGTLEGAGCLFTCPRSATPQPLSSSTSLDGLDLRQTREAAPLFRYVGPRRSLLLSIHQLHDAARVCDRLVLLSDGRVAGEGTLEELRSRAGLPNADVEEVFLALT
jgi:ABC-2 type transport system ATP-binding protein